MKIAHNSIRNAVSPWVLIVALATAGLLLSSTTAFAQKGSGGGGGGGGKSAGSSSKDSSQAKSDEKQAEQEAEKPRCPEIVGKHLLLEKMTEDYGLSCAQEDKIEPLLHDEESVSKPLLAYEGFTPEEKQAVMLKVKLAARAQIRPLLTPDQQKKSDEEAAAVAAAGSSPKKGGKKGATPKAASKEADAYTGEETLSSALASYSAFSPTQQKDLILQVKQAARREGAPELTSEQGLKSKRISRSFSSKFPEI
jgi:hypothetical protein